MLGLCQLIVALWLISVAFAKPAYLSPCWNNNNCPKDLVCRSIVDNSLKMDLRCRKKIQPGSKCRQSHHCVEGHICSLLRSPLGRHAVCHKRSSKGQMCMDKWQCAKGLVCRPGMQNLLCLEKGKLEEFCDLNEDCSAGLKCRKKFIRDMKKKCLALGKLGEPCDNNKQCQDGFMCRMASEEKKTIKKCMKKGRKGEFCVLDNDCEKHLHCRGHRQEPRLICSDRKADIGDYCVPWEWWHCSSSGADTCRRIKAGVMNTCQKNAQQGHYCEQDWHCDNNMKCKIGPNGYGKCEYRNKKGDKCWYSGNCPPWLTCRAAGPTKPYNDNYCLEPLPLWKTCEKDSACASEVCLKRSINKWKMCRNKLPFKAVCENNSHCIDGLTCRKKYAAAENKQCLVKLSAGSSCTSNSDCKDKHSCKERTCVRTGTEYGKFCRSSWECKGNLVCMNDKCSICRKKAECPENHVCENFKCLKS